MSESLYIKTIDRPVWPTEDPWPSPDRRFIDLLRARHQTLADKTAIVERDGSVTYGELWSRVDAMQFSLLAKGVRPGEVVAICAPNSLLVCTAFLAVMYYGAVPFIINYKLEALGNLADLNVRHYLVPRGSSAVRRYFNDFEWFEPGEFDARFDCYSNPCIPYMPLSDTALLVTSSGSRGKAKIVRLTDTGTRFNVASNVRALDLRADDVTAVILPMGYSYGLVGQFLSHLYVGATVVLLDSVFFFMQITRFMPHHRVTSIFMAPPLVRQIMYLYDRGLLKINCSSLRMVAVGGNRIESSAVRKAMTIFNCPIVKTYGLAEAGPRVATNRVTDPAQSTIESVGRPNRGVTIRILDEQGRDVPTGRPGIICIESPSVMAGYFNTSQPDDVRPFQSVMTKDIGYLDHEGHLFILGRRGDHFQAGGRQHWFREVESLLYAHFPFLKISLQRQQEAICISVVAMYDHVISVARVMEVLKGAFGPEAESLFLVELVKTNKMLNDK